MAVTTTSLVEGGKMCSSNSEKEVWAPNYTDSDLPRKQQRLFCLWNEQMHCEISEPKLM